MATTQCETENEDQKSVNDEISEYPGDSEIKRMLVILMTLDDFDDEREEVHKKFYKIPEEMKVNILYEIYKDIEEPEEFRDYALFTLFVNTATVVSTLEKIGKLEWFSDALLEEYDKEMCEVVKQRIGESIGHVASMRRDKWPKLQKLMKDWIVSDDDSLTKKALEFMKGFHCELPGAETLIVNSILGWNPSLRKPALSALYHNDVDADTLEMLLPTFMMLAERGCSALPSELETGALCKESTDWCNGEHSLALDRLYSLAVNTCGRGRSPNAQKSKRYQLLTEHMERFVNIAIETILSEVDCKGGNGHYTALQLISVLSEDHADRFPKESIHDIVVSCLLAIARELTSSFKPCNSTNPNVIEHNFNFATTVGHWHAEPILSSIGMERAGDHMANITQAFLKSDDWTRRASAMICWAILDKEWNRDRFTVLIEPANEGLNDNHPRVRAAAAEMLTTLLRGTSIDGDSDQIQKMVSSLVSLVSDKSPQVRASALVALAYFRSSRGHLAGHYSVLLPRLIAVLAESPKSHSTAIHVCSIDIFMNLATLVERHQFMEDFPAVENALCHLLTSYDKTHKWFERLIKSARRLCQVADIDCELIRLLDSIGQ